MIDPATLSMIIISSINLLVTAYTTVRSHHKIKSECCGGGKLEIETNREPSQAVTK